MDMSKSKKPKNVAAQALGLMRWQGKPEDAEIRSSGGKARAKKLTPERRKEIATKASRAAAKARKAKAAEDRRLAKNAATTGSSSQKKAG